VIHLVAVDHHEPGDRTGTLRDKYVGDTIASALNERGGGPRRDQRGGDVAEVGIGPSLPPDPGDALGVGRNRRPKLDSRVRGPWSVLAARLALTRRCHQIPLSFNSNSGVQFIKLNTHVQEIGVEMDGTIPQEQRHTSDHGGSRGPLWRRTWPAALGVLVAAGTAYGLSDSREVAPVVAASGLVYLAAAATGRPWAAWVAFGITFALIPMDKYTGLDATPLMLILAAGLLAVGLADRRTRPWWSLPLQTAAMLVLATTALLAIRLDATAGGLLVAGALLGHAAWDIHHHRTGRVVDRSLAQFCAVLDILVAALVAVITLTS
jgi:hypothetical protein